jgi:chemotaxis protein MotB
MSKKHKKGDHGEIHPDERWLITYADMITLLLAVFIVLYALSDTNVRKFNAFAQSLSSAFNTEVFSGTEAITVSTGQESAPGTGSADSGSGFIGSDARAVQASVKDFAVRNGMGGNVTVSEVPEGIVIRIQASLLFEAGRARLDGTSIGLLEQIASAVRPLPQKIRVVGHTDDTSTSGALYADNFELSTARAMSVLRFLVAAGISESRLSVAGAAQYDPLVPNDTAENRKANRRVDILVLYPSSGLPGSTGGSPLLPTLEPVLGGN